MKFALVMITLLSSASFADSAPNSCSEYEAINGTPSINDSMDSYKYVQLPNGDLKVCYQTYATKECGCHIQPAAAQPQR